MVLLDRNVHSAQHIGAVKQYENYMNQGRDKSQKIRYGS